MEDNNILKDNRYISINKANGNENINRKIFIFDDREIMGNFPRVQSLLDRDSEKFKYGLEQSTSTPSLFFQDPLFLTFDLVIDQKSPLFSEEQNGAGGFINNYSAIKSISNRRAIYDEFKKRLGELFNIGTNTNKNNKSYYINSISGLDKLSARIVKYENDKITINMNEDVSMISAYVAHLYNILSYSYKEQKEMIPANLLRFNLYIKLHDVRNMPLYLQSSETGTTMTFDKSYQIYILRDCNFIFRDSKNFEGTITRGGFDAPLANKPSDLSIDIYYKSIEIESEYPLIRHSFDLNGVDSLKLNNKKTSLVISNNNYPLFNNEFINNYKSVEEFYNEQNRNSSIINNNIPAPKPTYKYKYEYIHKHSSLDGLYGGDVFFPRIIEKSENQLIRNESIENREEKIKDSEYKFSSSVKNRYWDPPSNIDENGPQTLSSLELWRNSLMGQLNFENYLRELPLRLINMFLNGYHGMQEYYLQDYINIKKILSDERIITNIRDKDELNANQDRIDYILRKREFLDGEIVEYIDPKNKIFDVIYIPYTLPISEPFDVGYIPYTLPINDPFDAEYIPYRLKKREYLDGDRMVSRIRPIIRLNNETISYLIEPRLYLNGEFIPYDIEIREYLNGEFISYEFELRTYLDGEFIPYDIEQRDYLNGEFIPYAISPRIPLSGRIDTEIRIKLPLNATIDLTPRDVQPFEELYIDTTSRNKPEFEEKTIDYEIKPKLPLSGSISYEIKPKLPLTSTIDLTARNKPPFISEYLYEKIPFDRNVELGFLYINITKENILPLTYLYSKVDHFNSMADYRLYNNAFSEIKNLNNISIDLNSDYEKSMNLIYIHDNNINVKESINNISLYNNEIKKKNNLSLSYVHESEPLLKIMPEIKINNNVENDESDLNENIYLYNKINLDKDLEQSYLYPKKNHDKFIDKIVINQRDIIYKKTIDLGAVYEENINENNTLNLGKVYDKSSSEKYLLEPIKLYDKINNSENEINFGKLYEQTSKIRLMEKTLLYEKGEFNNNIEKITLDLESKQKDFLNGDKLNLDTNKKDIKLNGETINSEENIQTERDKEKKELNNERLG